MRITPLAYAGGNSSSTHDLVTLDAEHTTGFMPVVTQVQPTMTFNLPCAAQALRRAPKPREVPCRLKLN